VDKLLEMLIRYYSGERKLWRVVYHMLKFKSDYLAVSAQEYDQRFREREIRYLQRKSTKLGFTLSPSTTPVLAVS